MTGNNTRIFYTISLSLFFVSLAQAQITGLGLDANSNEPLAGAVVRVDSTYPDTDADGTFQLKTKVGDTIEMKYVGFQTCLNAIKDEYK